MRTERRLIEGGDEGVVSLWVLRCLPAQFTSRRSGVSNAALSSSIDILSASMGGISASRRAPFEHVQREVRVKITLVRGVAKIDNRRVGRVVGGGDEGGGCGGCREDKWKQQGPERDKVHFLNAGEQ